jgi:hypothetical protein
MRALHQDNARRVLVQEVGDERPKQFSVCVLWRSVGGELHLRLDRGSTDYVFDGHATVASKRLWHDGAPALDLAQL